MHTAREYKRRHKGNQLEEKGVWYGPTSLSLHVIPFCVCTVLTDGCVETYQKEKDKDRYTYRE